MDRERGRLPIHVAENNLHLQYCIRAVPWVIKVKINPMSAILAILCIEVAPREILCCTKFFLSGAHILGFTGVPNFGHFGVPRVFGWP